MTIYHGSDFLVALPSGLKDRTVHVFSLTDEGPSEVSLVVGQERPKVGETVELFAERLAADFFARLPMFRLLARKQIQVDLQPGVTLDFTWNSSEGGMYQRLILVYAKASNRMLVITATCRGDKLAAKHETMVAEFVANFRLRR